MVTTTFVPFAIFAGAALTAGLLFAAFWRTIYKVAVTISSRFVTAFEVAGLDRRPQEHVLTVAILIATIWVVVSLIVKPLLHVGVLMLVGAIVAGLLIYAGYIRYALYRRKEAFINQLEIVLRLMSNGLRAGLGLQQTLSLVVDETPDPAKYEFERMIGAINIGMSIYDALDEMAKRIPSNETLMMARCIRIQSQTGGDLAHVLEQLAQTIKERRRMRRKIASITAEGRTSSAILVVLPPLFVLFIVFAQPAMGKALLGTPVGHGTLLLVATCELLAILTLSRTLKVNV